MRAAAFVACVVLLVVMVTGATASAQTPVLLEGRTFVPADLACADLPADASPSTPFHIIAGHVPERRSVFALGEDVVINGGTPAGLEVNQRYYIRRLQHSRSSAGLLSEMLPSVRTAGWLTITAVDERVGIAHIDYTCDPVMTGDYLEPYVEPSLPTPSEAGAPQFDAPALVLSGVDRREVFGAGDVLSIRFTPGKTMTLGAVVAFYRDRGAGPRGMSYTSSRHASMPPPLVEIGEGIVVGVSGDHAQVAVKASRDAVRRGDFAVPR